MVQPKGVKVKTPRLQLHNIMVYRESRITRELETHLRCHFCPGKGALIWNQQKEIEINRQSKHETPYSPSSSLTKIPRETNIYLWSHFIHKDHQQRTIWTGTRVEEESNQRESEWGISDLPPNKSTSRKLSQCIIELISRVSFDWMNNLSKNMVKSDKTESSLTYPCCRSECMWLSEPFVL